MALRSIKGASIPLVVFEGADIKDAPTLAQKVAFLSDPAAYPAGCGAVVRRETHMSWVFLADGAAYKLKKPVRLPYLDFSSLPLRETACRAEFHLNQRLAPGIYKGVVPLTRRDGALAVGGGGEVVDWLVWMRRLDESRTLEARLLAGRLSRADLDALVVPLARFYRTARPAGLRPGELLARWRKAVAENLPVLLDPRSGMPRGLVRRLARVERQFLRQRSCQLAARAAHVVEGHGDLRPEHIWIGPEVKIIDRLEFSAKLRAIDPVDELAFLDLECARLGSPEAGRRLSQGVLRRLGQRPAPELYLFYRIYRALLRARLSIAHLLEPEPRTPEKWPPLARAYLKIAARDAARLAVLLRRPSGR